MTVRVLEVSALFREYGSLVERVLRRAGVEARDVPDARQEVFLVAHRRLSEFEGRAQPSTWLCAIAIRVASDFRRKAHRRRERPETEQGRTQLADAAHTSLPEQRDDLLQALDALEQVAAPQREVFVLFELFELPMNEVAARVGCPSKTAFSRLYAARRQLRIELRKRGLVAGACSLLFPAQGTWSAAPRQALNAAHSAGVSWPSWVMGAAAIALMVQSPDGDTVSLRASSPSVESPPSDAANRAGHLRATHGYRHAAEEAVPAPRPRSVQVVMPRPSGPNRRALQARPAAAPPVAEHVDFATEEFRVTRAGAHDPAPVGEHPWADLLRPQARVPPRLRVRGPADAADTIEQELREF